MAQIYIKDANGKNVTVEVGEEIAKFYRESLRAEWKQDAYEKYYTVSLDGITANGHEFKDEYIDRERDENEREHSKWRKTTMESIKKAIPYLTELQQLTIHRYYKLGMTIRQIAQMEGVAFQVVGKRIKRIEAKIEKIIKNF